MYNDQLLQSKLDECFSLDDVVVLINNADSTTRESVAAFYASRSLKHNGVDHDIEDYIPILLTDLAKAGAEFDLHESIIMGYAMALTCSYCHKDLSDSQRHIGIDGESTLCTACYANEIKSMLRNCGQDEIKKLRRRVEDLLRKSPDMLMQVASRLAAEGQIKFDDLINNLLG